MKVIKEAVTQTLGAYIDNCQANVAEWLTLRPILDIFNKRQTMREEGGTGSCGGGKRRFRSS